MAKTSEIKLAGQPKRTQSQILQMILENAIHTRATVETLADHVNHELSTRDHPDAEALAVGRARELTSRLSLLVEQHLERLSGEAKPSQWPYLDE